jgi:hypothetical protein
MILAVCRYQYCLPEDINSQPERKTNTQVTLILFDWKTSESFMYRTYEIDYKSNLFKITKQIIKDEVLLTVSCPIFPSILIAKNLLTGSLKKRSIDNLETQKKSISMKNSQFFDYLL